MPLNGKQIGRLAEIIEDVLRKHPWEDPSLDKEDTLAEKSEFSKEEWEQELEDRVNKDDLLPPYDEVSEILIDFLIGEMDALIYPKEMPHGSRE